MKRRERKFYPNRDSSDLPIPFYPFQTYIPEEEKQRMRSAFKDWIRELLEEIIVETPIQNTKNIDLDEKETFLKIKEACEYLSISRPTLHRLTKRGLVTKYYINSLPRYKRTELEQLPIKLEIK